jgi:hypothetical protein
MIWYSFRMRFFKNLLGPLWLIYVFGWYIEFHEYYEVSIVFWKWLFWLLVVWTVAIGGIGLWHRKKKIMTLTPLRVFLFALIMTWISGASVYSVLKPAVFAEPFQVVYYDDSTVGLIDENEELVAGVQPSIVKGSVMIDWPNSKNAFPEVVQSMFVTKNTFEFSVSLAMTLFKVVSAWLLLMILFFDLGAMITKQKKWSTMSFFQSVGVGMGVTMLVMFVLGLLGWLTPALVKGAITLLLLAGLPKLKLLAHSLWEAKLDVNLKKEQWWLIPVAIIFGIMGSLNILDAITPYPVGFDSLTRYHNTPNLLYQYESLVSGIVAYNFELLFSLGKFLFNSPLIGIQISQFANLLALGLLFMTFKSKFTWEESLGLLAVFVSLPMTTFMMHIDLKVDLPLLFFNLLAIHSVVRWWKAHDKQEKKKHLLWTGLWLGISFGVKYTAANLIVTIMAFMAYVTWGGLGAAAVTFLALGAFGYMNYLFPLDSYDMGTQKLIWNLFGGIGLLMVAKIALQKKISKAKLMPFFMVGGLTLLLVLPWFIYFGMTANSFAPREMLRGEIHTPKVSGSTFGVDEKMCTDAFRYNELELYTGDHETHSLLLPLSIIWESTINSAIPNNRITDISFLFLGFALFVLFAWPEIRSKDPDMSKIAGFTMLYGFLWIVTSQGIIWYGIPMFVGGMMIFAKAWKTEKWAMIVLLGWLIMSLFFRYSDSINQNAAMLHSGGLTDEELYTNQSVRGATEIAAVLNSEEGKTKNLYLAGRFINYFVEENDRRIYIDQILNKWACVFKHDDPQVSIDRFNELNFGYVLVMQDGLKVEQDPTGPLHQQFKDFEAFANEHLVKEVTRAGVTLYSVPE